MINDHLLRLLFLVCLIGYLWLIDGGWPKAKGWLFRELHPVFGILYWGVIVVGSIKIGTMMPDLVGEYTRYQIRQETGAELDAKLRTLSTKVESRTDAPVVNTNHRPFFRSRSLARVRTIRPSAAVVPVPIVPPVAPAVLSLPAVNTVNYGCGTK